MWWGERNTARIHFVPEHKGKRGQRVGQRWHVDIHSPSGALLFVCRPQGFHSIDEARAALKSLGRLKVTVEHP